MEATLDLSRLVAAARAGDLGAYERLIAATQDMVYAVVRRVLRERADALDASQETYLRAYRGLARLTDTAAFPGYLRRIAIRAAYDVRRARRVSFAPSLDDDALPVLDEQEQRWSSSQRAALARALVVLSRDERRAIDRFYHGGWSLSRLADDAHTSEPAMRKRLSRTREKLREEMEKMERTSTNGEVIPEGLSDRVVELLSRPTLVDLPESKVGQLTQRLKSLFSDYVAVETSEIIDLASARAQLLGCGVYKPEVVSLLGGDPAHHVGLGLGLGLERLAALHFQVADIRKLTATA